MAYCVDNKFAKYKVTPSTESSVHTWDSAELYKTSYLQQSAKNVFFIIKNDLSP